MVTLQQVLDLVSKFAIVGGGLWLVWGVIVLAGGLKDKNGPVYLDELDPDRGDMNTEIMPECGIMCYLSMK